jgi:uncharacterized protein (DUF736 family)
MKIGAGWVKDTKDGKRYMSCVINLPLLGELSFVMYRTEKKTKEGSPDYEIYWYGERQKNGTNIEKSEKFEDDIPF